MNSYEQILRAEVARWPVDSAAAAVVNARGVQSVCGDGRVYHWASVTKLLAALTVLHATNDGVLALDEPAGPPGSTVRHLLSHASGLALDTDRIVAPPGRRRIYSNRGFEVLADHLESRTGLPFGTSMRERVLTPLGMLGTRLEGSPAHGASGPMADLALLAQELLRPQRLPADVVKAATTPEFPELSGVVPGFGRQEPNPWGLGFELRGAKTPHWMSPENAPTAFGHFGQSGSFLWVDPRAGLACVAATDTPFGPWAAEAWPRLSTRVLHAAADTTEDLQIKEAAS